MVDKIDEDIVHILIATQIALFDTVFSGKRVYAARLPLDNAWICGGTFKHVWRSNKTMLIKF